MILFIRNGVWIFLSFTIFAVLHSVLAGLEPKKRLEAVLDRYVIEGWYRLAYNAFAVITVLPTLILVAVLPDQRLLQVGLPWSLGLRVLQVVGLAGLVGALFVTDIFQFAGIKQAVAFLSGEPLPLPVSPLQEHGLYKYVRHPLYFFSLLVIWPNPVVTVNSLWLNIAITLYFVLGSLIEEQRLLQIYGDAYKDYRRRISWLIPWFPR